MRFRYRGAVYAGFDHPYNTTLLNERAVEVAIAKRWLRAARGVGLEVGNVLGHYGVHGHRVVDLYEEAAGVENIDVFDVSDGAPWIVSVSTLEHIDRAVDALGHLRSLLAPGGRMLITIGSGQHAELDAYLASGAGADRACTLRRDGATWAETPTPEFLPYASSTEWAESVWIGEWGTT